MQIKDVRPEPFVKQIRCDRCGSLSSFGEVEFHECASIDLKAGFASIFGDGNDVQIDLCQHCLKVALGPWLRVSAPVARQERLLKSLSLFDPDRHGGEFPTAADVSLQRPEDLPPQDRRSLTSPTARRHRIAQARRIKRYGMPLFFVPTISSLRGIRQRYQRRQAEFLRHSRVAIERPEAAGDAIPADLVVAKLRANVDEARKRRSISDEPSASPPLGVGASHRSEE